MLTTTITFAGNLVEDPTLEFTTAGTPVAGFRVLVNRRTKQGDNWVDATPTSHACKLYGKAAETVAESLMRGDRVIVHGTVRTETWTDKDTGDHRFKDLVIVDEVGPSLRYAAARVQRFAREDESAAEVEDPWDSPTGEV